MSNQINWSNVNYTDLPHTFYGRGIVSPCGRYYVSTRSEGSQIYCLNWAMLDLYTNEYVDGFRFRKDAVAHAESYERAVS